MVPKAPLTQKMPCGSRAPGQMHLGLLPSSRVAASLAEVLRHSATVGSFYFDTVLPLSWATLLWALNTLGLARPWRGPPGSGHHTPCPWPACPSIHASAHPLRINSHETNTPLLSHRGQVSLKAILMHHLLSDLKQIREGLSPSLKSVTHTVISMDQGAIFFQELPNVRRLSPFLLSAGIFDFLKLASVLRSTMLLFSGGVM